MMPAHQTTAHVTPEQALKTARAAGAKALAHALSTTGQSREEIAASLDCVASRVSAFIDPEHPAMMCISRASMLPPSAARAVASFVAGPAFLVIETPSDVEAVTFADIASSQRSTASAVTEAIDGVADGHLSRAEGERLEAACDKAIADLFRLRAAAKRARREGVLGMPRLIGKAVSK